MARSFAFAFNNSHFSDRLLLFEVSSSSLIRPHYKEIVQSKTEENGELLHITGNEEDRERLDVEINGESSEGLHEEMKEGSNEKRLQLHVNSVILASHSEYFMSLFGNGMSESSSEVVVVQVTEEERLGLMSLIEYMYTGHLKEPSNTESSLMLLCLADRFAIYSCMEPLVEVFKSYPSTLHDCLLVLGLPETLKSNETVRPIVESCCCYLRERFRDISNTKHRSELLSLSVEGFKVVLGSDLLDIQYEEEVFFCLSDWIETNYNDVESRAMVAFELAEMVRFPWLTGDFLEDIVSESPLMQNHACQALVMEALRFRAYTQARQQRVMLETSSHNRFRPRNNLILENFWGSCKTYVLHQTETSCHAHFEFPLELVICMGESFRSRTLALGPDSSKYNFYLSAAPLTIKTAYNARVTCCVALMCAKNPMWNRGSDEESHSNSNNTWLEYKISMKRQYSQDYDSSDSGHCDLGASEGACAQFDDLFSGWFVERGFSFPRWNLSINGSISFKLELRLCSKANDAESNA